MDSTGSTPKTSRTVKLSTPLGKDVRMPCHEGVLHSVALDSSAKTSTTRAELFSLDTTSGELKGHEMPLPTAVSSNGALHRSEWIRGLNPPASRRHRAT